MKIIPIGDTLKQRVGWSSQEKITKKPRPIKADCEKIHFLDLYTTDDMEKD